MPDKYIVIGICNIIHFITYALTTCNIFLFICESTNRINLSPLRIGLASFRVTGSGLQFTLFLTRTMNKRGFGFSSPISQYRGIYSETPGRTFYGRGYGDDNLDIYVPVSIRNPTLVEGKFTKPPSKKDL